MSVRRLESGRYQARVWARGRQVASRTFDRKRDADAWDRAQRTALAAGTWTDPVAGQTTVAELAERFLATKAHRTPSYRESLESSVARHVVPALGRRPISSVSPSDVDAWVSRMLRDHSIHTTRSAVGVLRQVFNIAVRDGWVSRSPVDHVRLPQQPRTEPRPLSAAQLAALVDEMPTTRDRLMTLVMGFGGLRFGEAAALRARCVVGNRLRLTESVTHGRGGVRWGDLKNHTARSVSLPPSVGAELRLYVERMDSATLVFGSSADTPLERGNWSSRVLEPAAACAGLPRVLPHDLRDTAASLAIAAGASVVVVARMLGHADASVTLKHYAAMFPDDLDDLALVLDGVRSSTGTAPARVDPRGVPK